MPKIFISYRPENSQHLADRLHAVLKKYVANPRRDILFSTADIALGVDVVQQVDARVAQCEVLLALIGPDWLNVRHLRTGRRRLDDPKDPVRVEIASALRRGIPVAPVLLEGAAMPAEKDLPNDLKQLTRQNASEIRPLSFESDAELMIRGLRLDEMGQKSEPGAAPSRSVMLADPGPRKIVLAAALGVAVLAGGSAWAWFTNPGDWRGRGGAPSLAQVAGPPAKGADVRTASAGAAGGSPSHAPPAAPAAANPAAGAPAKIEPDDRALRDEAAWRTAGAGTTPAAFEIYLRDFPTGVHAAEARARIAALTASASAAAPGVNASPPAALTPKRNIRAGETFRDCPDCPEMVALRAGSFVMGSPDSEAGRGGDEGPQRLVEVRSFAAGKYEVTWEEWKGCVAAGGCAAASDVGSDSGRRPVTSISWSDARAFAVWLSRKTGQTYRLLSEAEWEYAARSETYGPYPWGPAASHDQANYGKDQCCEGLASGRDRWVGSAPVGSFPANAFGLHDMHGNVWEWVEDCYETSYAAGQADDGRAFTKNPCPNRVSRGGSWSSDPSFMRSAVRDWIIPTKRGGGLGFRLARTL